MTDGLPPLSAIRVFEAAARLGNFTRAAKELGMTQAAVSYQIRILEDRVGLSLFRREPRGVTPTAEGAHLARRTGEALEILRQAYAEVRSQMEETLVISVLATFAAHVLAPRLGRFQVAHPEFTTRIDVNHKLVDLNAGEASVAVRAGTGDWPGLRADLLMRARYTPMLSPALIDEYGPLREPSDLLRLPLIDAADPSWRNWFAAAGIEAPDILQQKHHSLGAQFLEAQAAMAGQGVCLLTPEYYRDLLARGELVQPFDIVSEDDVSIWLVYPERRRNAPSVRAFRDWLLGEMHELTVQSRNLEQP